MWDAFIDGYRAVRPITPDDFEAALRLVIVRHFWLMGEYASRAPEWGSNTVGWIAREANFLRTGRPQQFVDVCSEFRFQRGQLSWGMAASGRQGMNGHGSNAPLVVHTELELSTADTHHSIDC